MLKPPGEALRRLVYGSFTESAGIPTVFGMRSWSRKNWMQIGYDESTVRVVVAVSFSVCTVTAYVSGGTSVVLTWNDT